MVDSGQTEVQPVGFASHDHPGAVVEVVQRADLPERLGAEFFTRPDRPSFDILMLVHHGNGRHTIDFEKIALVPSRLVRTRPGQVQSWDFSTDVDATLVFSRAVHPLSRSAPTRRPAAISAPTRSPRPRRSSTRCAGNRVASTATTRPLG